MNETFHFIQLEILRELLFNPNTNFSTLNKRGIRSDQLSYHLKQLIAGEFITKIGKAYRLTSRGKECANRIDTEAPSVKFEKPPKVSTICHIFLGGNYNSKTVQQVRLKEPFFGYHGGITGKVKYGETTLEGARREVFEETGLKGDLIYHGLVHHINFTKGELVEDKYLIAYTMLNAEGKLKAEGEGFKNKWVSVDEYRQAIPIYDGELDILDMCILPDQGHFIEVVNDLKEF